MGPFSSCRRTSLERAQSAGRTQVLAQFCRESTPHPNPPRSRRRGRETRVTCSTTPWYFVAPLEVPSPLNGERAGVRGENSRSYPPSSPASATARACLAAHFLDATLAPADPPKSCPAQTAHPLIANSKTGASGCCAIANTHLAPRPSRVVRESRVGLHPIPNCSAPRRNRNQDSARPLCVAAEICKRRNGGHAKWPTTSSPPRWISCAERGRLSPGSSQAGLTDGLRTFKRPTVLSPPQSLSPLRGEGSRIRKSLDNSRASRFFDACCSRKKSSSVENHKSSGPAIFSPSS